MGEQRDGSGILFRVSEKSKASAPDFHGEAKYRGERIRLVGWRKQGKKVAFLSVSLEPWKERREPGEDRKR
jgi:hypothetical protein